VKKTKLSFRALRIAVVSVFALAVLALTGCDGGGGTGPSMVTVTFNGNSALVTGTMPAPQTVTSGTSITLPGQTGFNKPEHALAGWNTNADGTGTTLSPGSTFTVTGNVTLFAIWAVPVTMGITVTGITDNFGESAVLALMHPGTMNYAVWDYSSIIGSSVTFSVTAIPGTYDIHLRLWGDNGGLFVAASRDLVAGPQTIPLSEFSRIDPISITVTGIPNTYIDGDGVMILNTPGYFNWAEDYWTCIDGSSVTFTFFVLPGTYDIQLEFYFWCNEEDEEMMSVYILSSKSLVAGNQNIALGQFTHLDPITITITEISDYIGYWGGFDLLIPGTYTFVAWSNWVEIEANTTFTVFVPPGTYDVVLFLGNGSWIAYIASARAITAGDNNIPFSAFTYHDSGTWASPASAPDPAPASRVLPDSSRARASALRAR